MIGLPAALTITLALGSASDPEDSSQDTIDAISIRETKIDVVPASEAAKEPPNLDAPVAVPPAPLLSEHHDRSRDYLDPFLGRAIYPEISARFHTAFVRETFDEGSDDSAPHGNMALASRIDLSLWFLDLRFPLSTSAAVEPAELVLKVPFSVGAHYLAPIVAAHFPIQDGLNDAVYEAGLGYHGAFGKLSLKLEATAFNGNFERNADSGVSGMVGWNAAAGFLLLENLGVIVEADGITAVSERTGEAQPQIGDTVVRILPGLRWFPKNDAGLHLGVSGVISVVPAEYDLLRRRGAMLELGYSFL